MLALAEPGADKSGSRVGGSQSSRKKRDAEARAKEKEAVAAEPLDLEEASTALFAWLQELAEDYCRGNRAARIQCVCDVARCRAREACFLLGARGWDVEAALILHFSGDGANEANVLRGGAEGSWSSHGLKLRQEEKECPICCENYGGAGEKPAVTRCCFQVLCSHCHNRLAGDPDGFQCPFCRSMDPEYPGSGILGGTLRFAGRAASEAGSFLQGLAMAARDVESPPRERPWSGAVAAEAAQAGRHRQRFYHEAGGGPLPHIAAEPPMPPPRSQASSARGRPVAHEYSTTFDAMRHFGALGGGAWHSYPIR